MMRDLSFNEELTQGSGVRNSLFHVVPDSLVINRTELFDIDQKNYNDFRFQLDRYCLFYDWLDEYIALLGNVRRNINVVKFRHECPGS